MQSTHELAISILKLLFTYRRALGGKHEDSHYCDLCHSPFLTKIQRFITAKQPIHLVLPGFPAKSPNVNKVFGKLPDKGEQLALQFLHSLCESVKSLYVHGAHITICSDGHVFADLVEVSDADVDAYNQGINDLIQCQQLNNLNLFGLWSIYGDMDNEAKRKKFIHECTQSDADIKRLIKNVPRELAIFNGIEKFLLEDFIFIEPTKSKNALRKKAHALTYRVIQRSHGWSEMVEKYFPHAIRLSIHPQPHHFHKLGIYLVKTKNNWLTPWHGVAVLSKGQFELMKKQDAIKLSASVVMEEDRPSYFIV